MYIINHNIDHKIYFIYEVSSQFPATNKNKVLKVKFVADVENSVTENC